MPKAKSTHITPTVGRIVYFFATVNPGWGDHGDVTTPRAAIVAKVYDDGSLNLLVIDRNGAPHPVVAVELVQDGEKPTGTWWCEWMPYQRAVAAGQIPATQHATPQKPLPA